MPHILIVCTANICRSPVVEALFRRRLEARGLAWRVSSGGTLAENGMSAARHSIELMRERGIDISGHRSRLVEREHIEDADLVVCMENGHKEALRVENPDQAKKIRLFASLVGSYHDIEDPYGGPRGGYETMVAEVETLVDEAVPRLVDAFRGKPSSA
ncbi:MAG: low molecular weight protein-tyrosine-phosphatase [Acidobacteriota bacterium]